MHNSITYVRPSEKSSHQGNLIRLARSDYDWGRRYNVGQKNGAGIQIRYKLSENIASNVCDVCKYLYVLKLNCVVGFVFLLKCSIYFQELQSGDESPN